MKILSLDPSGNFKEGKGTTGDRHIPFVLERIKNSYYTVREGKLYKNNKEIGYTTTSGYRMLSTNDKEGNPVRVFIHRVMYAYFNGFIDGRSINHKDGNKLNNVPENLELLSLSDNSRHQWEIGLGKRGSEVPHAKLNEEKVLKIKKLLEEGNLTQKEIANMYGVSRECITRIKAGKRWKHVGQNTID